jgi:DnaJ-class molecular chaperone
MTFATCTRCYGSKKVPCMGGMKKTCGLCKGIGKVEIVEPTQTLPPTITNKRPKRKAIQMDIEKEVGAYE